MLVKEAKKLTTTARAHIASKNFAFEKERRYPIHDIAHARNALARVSAFGTPAEKKEVRREVYSKYPSLREHARERGKLASLARQAEKVAGKRLPPVTTPQLLMNPEMHARQMEEYLREKAREKPMRPAKAMAAGAGLLGGLGALSGALGAPKGKRLKHALGIGALAGLGGGLSAYELARLKKMRIENARELEKLPEKERRAIIGDLLGRRAALTDIANFRQGLPRVIRANRRALSRYGVG